MPIRNILILTVCQLISATGAIVIITLGGIIGSKLTSDPSLATLPVSMVVLFGAAATIPATMLMKRIGRRYGFAFGSLTAAVSMAIIGVALHRQSFVLFAFAAALFGLNMAFTLQFRYAAAESVDAKYAPRAISLVLVGAIGGAWVGPELVKYGEFAVASVQYLGSFLGVLGLFLIQALLHLTLGPLRGEDKSIKQKPPRPLGKIAAQPIFIVAMLGGAVAYGVMTFIMTATPLSMHIHDGFSLDDTRQVIRGHVLAMYIPSLISGFLIEKFGVVRMMSLGAIGLIGACLIGLQGQEYMNYLGALVLLGVGWNFLYVGGTIMLTRTYEMSERFRAQGVNEVCVFGMSALASLLAGTIIHAYGWLTLVLVPFPLLAIALFGLFYVRKDPLAARLQATPA
ncbi:MAG: MFS transporter [Woeseia sp.]|jgi:MFS family permease|nr:MFS transporter [Woeseia sp.]